MACDVSPVAMFFKEKSSKKKTYILYPKIKRTKRVTRTICFQDEIWPRMICLWNLWGQNMTQPRCSCSAWQKEASYTNAPLMSCSPSGDLCSHVVGLLEENGDSWTADPQSNPQFPPAMGRGHRWTFLGEPLQNSVARKMWAGKGGKIPLG